MLKPVLLFFVFISFTACLTAQSFSFKNYTTNDGLVQTDITAITQDRKGNIWIGTKGGISIFDGKNFTNYDERDLLQSLHINALLCDSSGVMWIATANGLLKYNNGFTTFFQAGAPKNNVVTCLSATVHNEIFFVCNNSVYVVKGRSAEKFSISKNIDNNVALLSFDRDDNLWIVTNDLAVYKKDNRSLTPIRTPFTAEEKKEGLGFLKILGKQGPVPYFVTNFGSFYVKEDSLIHFVYQYPQFARARVGNAMYALQEDDSTLWVGGTMGLSKIAGSSITRYVKDNGFCDNSVSCIFTDREHNTWIGCTFNGVYKLSNEALFHLNPLNESFDLRHVSGILPVSANTTLLSTWGKGLFAFQNDSLFPVKFPSPSIRYITCLFGLGGSTYIGWFGKGLWQMNNATRKITPVAGFVKDEAVEMIYKSADHLVITTLGKTCFLTDDHFAIKASVRLNEDGSIIVLKGKIYQMNSAGQVDLLDDNFKVVKKNIFPEVLSPVTEIAYYRDNFLVATFGQGLFVYSQQGKLVKRLDKKNGLNTNIVTSLLVDGAQLFIGTNLGLIRAGLPDLETIKIFKENEGMFNWECRRNGLKKGAGGSIIIATTNGPYIYYPDKDVASQYTSGVLTVAGFSYGSKSKKQVFFSPAETDLQITDVIEYKDNKVAITLKGISQRNPDDIVYHYQLQGYDPMWVSTANPLITCDDLEPGDYKLKAFITIGDFTSKLVSLKFSIDKPLSGKLWFQALLILFLSALCWLLLTIGNRIYQKYIQSKMVSRLEADIALKKQLTAHSFSLSQEQYKEIAGFTLGSRQKETMKLVPLFVEDASTRLRLLWKRDKVSLAEIHAHFDELIAPYSPEAVIYHKLSVGDEEIPVEAAFHLLQVFSLYMVTNLYQSGAAVFSLDSEKKATGHLLLRFYTVTHIPAPHKQSTYLFLKQAIEQQKPVGVTMDVIDNLELGNMVVAEINRQNEKLP